MDKKTIALMIAAPLLLQGCFADVGLSTGIQMGLQAKKANSAVKTEKEMQAKVEAAMKTADERKAQALTEDGAPNAPAAAPGNIAMPDPGAAMRKAMEDSK